jgi:hypothetical protein
LLAADQFSPKNRHALVSIVNDAFLPEKTLVGKVDHELMSLGLFGSNGRNQMARP